MAHLGAIMGPEGNIAMSPVPRPTRPGNMLPKALCVALCWPVLVSRVTVVALWSLDTRGEAAGERDNIAPWGNESCVMSCWAGVQDGTATPQRRGNSPWSLGELCESREAGGAKVPGESTWHALWRQ